MFELDFAEHRSAKKQGLSKEDRRFLNIAETGMPDATTVTTNFLSP